MHVSDLALSRGENILVEDLKLSISSGQVIWLTGPNGIGKTSLLLACAGLLSPDHGHVNWISNGKDCKASEAVCYAAHRGPERAGLTLGEEMKFWQAIYRDDISLQERLAQVGLKNRETTPVSGLSAGQSRRLSLARLLTSKRACWLMDEPLAGLDSDGRQLVMTVLSEHLKRGGVALIASHQSVAIPDIKAQKLIMAPPI